MAFPFSDLPTAATIPAAEQMLEHLPLTDEGQVVAPVNKIAAHVKSEKEVVTLSLSKKRSGELTAEVGDADDSFDDSFCFFRDAAALNARNTRKAMLSESSKVIDSIIYKHGRTLHSENRAEQIGKAESMIAELLTPENQTHLTTAGIITDFEEMRADHVALKSVMEQSAALEAVKGNITSPYKAGRALVKSLRDLYDIVEINARIGEPEFITTLELFDESLKKIRPLMKSRGAEIEIKA